jgi:hypothetical protein
VVRRRCADGWSPAVTSLGRPRLVTVPVRIQGSSATGVADDSAVDEGPAPALRLLCAGLVFYLAFGKGFAYAGWPPVYVGEVLLLAIGVAAVRRSPVLPRQPAAAVAGGLVALAAVQGAVDRLHGVVPLLETIRGLAPIYYIAFAFGTYSLLRDFERRAGRLRAHKAINTAAARWAPFVLGSVMSLTILTYISRGPLFVWPGSGGPLLSPKLGDRAIALVLILPLLVAPPIVTRWARWRTVLLAAWAGAAAMASLSRGAFLAMLAGLLFFRPNLARLSKALFVALAFVLLLYVSGLRFDTGRREISYDALVAAAASVSGSDTGELSGTYLSTRNWRADWWAAIWADVRSQDMVLHGHGWGDNLTLRYGVTHQIPADEGRTLRLPHNLFFSLAGRAGLIMVVGFFLVPVLTIGRTFQSRGGRDPLPLLAHAVRAAIAAAITTSLFDVYIESPQGGIVFWILIGYLWWATASPLAAHSGGHRRLGRSGTAASGSSGSAGVTP